MKTLRAVLACALIASITVLTGCGGSTTQVESQNSAVELDREVTIDPMTFSVSSTWIEETRDYDGVGLRMTTNEYSLDNGEDGFLIVTVSENIPTDYKSGEPTSFEERYSDSNSDFVKDELSDVSETVIDGARATTYTRTIQIDSDSLEEIERGLYMVRGNYTFSIYGVGIDNDLVDAVIETVSLA